MEQHKEELLAFLIEEARKRIDFKFRKGNKEHGGDLLNKTPLELIEEGLNETVDQWVYLNAAKIILLKKGDQDATN